MLYVKDPSARLQTRESIWIGSKPSLPGSGSQGLVARPTDRHAHRASVAPQVIFSRSWELGNQA